MRRRWRRRRFEGPPPALVTLALGVLLAAAVIGLLQARLRPVVAALARAQTQNTMAAVLERTVADDLAQRGVSYGDLVTIQRDGEGAITALTCDMASLNLLRAELVSQVLDTLDDAGQSTVRVPLGSLFDSELLWARGPSIRARVLAAGTVSAEFESEFSSAGVNQTMHRIWLDLSVPMTVLLPGGGVEAEVNTRLCVAETVIVGQVPETYLQLDGPPASG